MTPWEIVADINAGWVIPPTQKQLEKCLIQVLKMDENILNMMGERAKEYVQNNFEWTLIASKMKIFYQWLLNGGRKPDFIYKLRGKQRQILPTKKHFTYHGIDL